MIIINLSNIYVNSKFCGTFYEKGLRDINQDSICLIKVQTSRGEALMAIVCDGLGGMDAGEVASGYVIEEFVKWFYKEFLKLLLDNKSYSLIVKSIIKKLFSCHNALKEYGLSYNINLGTTFSMFLAYNCTGVIFHIGDSAIFKLNRKMSKLTPFHIEEIDKLACCIGIGSFYKPYIKKLFIKKNISFLLCTDGFYHYIKANEILNSFNSKKNLSDEHINRILKTIGKMNLLRGETDNMSAIYIKY